MRKEEIKRRLKALQAYEFSVYREDSEAADRELMRILEAKSRLNAMLTALEAT